MKTEQLNEAARLVFDAYATPRDRYADDDGYIIFLRKQVTAAHTALQQFKTSLVDDNDTAKRLRALCTRLGIAGAVPEDDVTLMQCLFSVLGMINSALNAVGASVPVQSTYRHDYPSRPSVSKAEANKARDDKNLYGIGFTVNGWHVPAQTVACWGLTTYSLTQPQHGLMLVQEPKYTVTGCAIVNRATGRPIPADEPIFILRASDRRAASIIGEYAEMCEEPLHGRAVTERFIQFGAWAEANPERMKEPDTSAAELVVIASVNEV